MGLPISLHLLKIFVYFVPLKIVLILGLVEHFIKIETLFYNLENVLCGYSICVGYGSILVIERRIGYQ
jgi:hypothetical protein